MFMISIFIPRNVSENCYFFDEVMTNFWRNIMYRSSHYLGNVYDIHQAFPALRLNPVASTKVREKIFLKDLISL